jgi:DNA-binding transcriptional LysR family regulator
MPHSEMSLKWLSVFRAVAQSGSVDASAKQLGLANSTVSHHLAKLEAHLGAKLIDHSHRPMALTADGVVFLRSVEQALTILEDAAQRVSTITSHGLSQLRFAMIEDFEAEIGPDIARLLASLFPDCQFKHMTRVSHEILGLLKDRKLDIGVCTCPETAVPDVTELALLNDPFVLAVPQGCMVTGAALIGGASDLPLLRYSDDQIIGRMIAAQLRRLRLSLDHSFELDSTASMLGIIAQEGGWAITTPSNYMRSQRFRSQIKLLPFPGKGFARRISVFVGEPRAEPVAQSVATALRVLLKRHAILPAVREYPWLEQSYYLLPEIRPDQ